MENLTKIVNLFGEDIYAATKDEDKVKYITKWFQNLEEREERVRNKEMELELKGYTLPERYK